MQTQTPPHISNNICGMSLKTLSAKDETSHTIVSCLTGKVGEAVTLKIKLGRGDAPCAPALQDKIDVAKSSQHFNLQIL